MQVGPLFELIVSVLRSYPGIFSNMAVDILYLVVLGLVASQYARVQSTEEKLYGTAKNKAFYQTASAIGLGLIGGLLASLLLVLVGVSVTDSGIVYLLPLAVLLYLFSPRFLCYSYAGGLAGLSYLVFGWPKINVPAVMALVACLHAAEAFLIRISGHSCSTPLYVSHENGDVVGGFALQRFWPIPLIVLFLIKVPNLSYLQGLIHLPDWWPLIKAPDIAGPGQPVFAMMPVIAALGYGDIAVAKNPLEKARSTSKNLVVFSGVLLALSIAASRWPLFAWIAVLFSPIGHEIVIKVGLKEEFGEPPIYVPAEKGVKLLDVVEGSPAKNAGLMTGDVICFVNDNEVNSRDDLEDKAASLETGPVTLLVSTTRHSPGLHKVILDRHSAEPLGLIPVPHPDDQAVVRPYTEGILLRFLKNLWQKKHNSH